MKREQEMTFEFENIDGPAAFELNAIRDKIHDWAKKKGWWGPSKDAVQSREIAMEHDRSGATLKAEAFRAVANALDEMGRNKFELIALMHSELSECLEFLRKPNPDGTPQMDDHVPELTGEEAELADCMIRIFDYCGAFGIDIGRAIQMKHAYNIKRPYRHGGKAA